MCAYSSTAVWIEEKRASLRSLAGFFCTTDVWMMRLRLDFGMVAVFVVVCCGRECCWSSFASLQVAPAAKFREHGPAPSLSIAVYQNNISLTVAPSLVLQHGFDWIIMNTK